MTGNLYHLLASRFPRDSSQTAMEVPGGTTLTYRDLDELSSAYTGVLKHADVQPGDRVAVRLHKSPEAVALYLACLRAGAIYLPMNPAYTEAEVAYLLEDAGPRVFVCDPGEEGNLGALAAQKGCAFVLTLDQVGNGSLVEQSGKVEPAKEIAERGAEDIAAILYTSGTTGKPKGAMLSHGNLASNGLTLHKAWGFVPGDVLLHALPIFHVHGLFIATHCALLNGSKMIFLPSFDAETVVGLLQSASVFMGVPTYYTRLLANERFGRDVAGHMRLFVSGSAPLMEDTFWEFERRTGLRILERYGMTETGMNTSNPYEGERIPGSVGPPLPGVEVRVRSEAGDLLSDGEIGVLEVRGPNVFKGYWRNPEKTAEEFQDDGFFVTGDLSRIEPNGYVSIVGRSKDLIISGGLNVYPKEIETALLELDGISDAAVFGIPHTDFGEAVMAAVIADTGKTEADIKGALKGSLANFKMPKKVLFLDEIPRNTMGKVQKNKLRETYKDYFS